MYPRSETPGTITCLLRYARMIDRRIESIEGYRTGKRFRRRSFLSAVNSTRKSKTGTNDGGSGASRRGHERRRNFVSNVFHLLGFVLASVTLRESYEGTRRSLNGDRSIMCASGGQVFDS